MEKIAIVGLGGVGGFLAATLTGTGHQVTAVARGKRGEKIKAEGLTFHRGEATRQIPLDGVVSSIGELEKQDIIFVCVKNYSLEAACEELQGIIDEETILVPVMNGADPGDRMRESLHKGIILDSVIYIVAYANADYSITQESDFAVVHLGSQVAGHDDAVSRVAEVLKAAQIDVRISDNIASEIWRKYIMNCAYNVATAAYNKTIGQLREDEETAKEYVALLQEAYDVAHAKGVDLAEKVVTSFTKQFYEKIGYEATSSLQRDLWSGLPTELEVFSGYLVKEAARLGVAVPVSQKMYELLQKHEATRSISY